MYWQEIKRDEVDNWNQLLKKTNSSFFQYPYYAKGYNKFLFSKPFFTVLYNNHNDTTGFCCILTIRVPFLKLGLILRGPVYWGKPTELNESIRSLKDYLLKKGYNLIRISPDDDSVENALIEDKDYSKIDIFPFYKGSQGYDLIVRNIPSSELLGSFRPTCRHKIRYQEQMNFIYSKAKSKDDLRSVYLLFEKVGQKKNFSYRPFDSYNAIFEEGLNNDLCTVYTVHLENRLVCAAFIVKDRLSYNYMSGALDLGDLNPKYSPANNMHYLIMQDCFYKDNKQYYNLSYSSPESGVYVFKMSFRPQLIKKPSSYSLSTEGAISKFFLRLNSGNIRKIKNYLRSIIHTIRS